MTPTRPDTRHEWVGRAACAGLDTDIFYPEHGKTGSAAKLVCSICVIRVECLDYAVHAIEDHGIWGGTTREERQTIRRTTRKTADVDGTNIRTER